MEEVKNTQIKIFEEKQVRTLWDKETEEWYFSVVDVIAVLTDSPNPRNYWKVLKHRLNGEGSELVTNCNQLKMLSSDGKMYKTDCMTTSLQSLTKTRNRNSRIPTTVAFFATLS
jgi:hypothetical protein